MDPLHATIGEFAAEGYTHVEANCQRCRVMRLRPIDQLPKMSMGLTLAVLARRLRCVECFEALCRSSRGGYALDSLRILRRILKGECD